MKVIRLQKTRILTAVILTITCFSFSNSFASRFEIKTELEENHAEMVSEKCEQYYKALFSNYFERSFSKLVIHYQKDKDSFRETVYDNHLKMEELPDLYASSIPAAYVSSIKNAEDELLRQVTRHFIEVNLENTPYWFKNELCKFFSENACFKDDEVVFREPNYKYYQPIKKNVAEGKRLIVKKLFPYSDSTFMNWELGSPFAQTFFYWLSENNYFKIYLKNISEYGYKLETLEKTLGEPFGKINKNLGDYYERDFTEQRRLYEAQKIVDLKERKETLIKLAEDFPYYDKARLELLKTYFRGKDYFKAIEIGESLISDPDSAYYEDALKYTANAYLKNLEYDKALDLYNKLWEERGVCLENYKLAYVIGNCYVYLDDIQQAKKWYEIFLNNRWKKTELEKQAQYAEKFIQEMNN